VTIDDQESPPQRVAPISVPSEPPRLPQPNDSQPAAVRDAFRQCGFALGKEIAWIEEALTLEHRIVTASTSSKLRNHRYSSALLLWSRVYTVGQELLRAATWGAYPVCPPLIRASLEWLAAEQAVVGREQSEYETWLREAFQPEVELAGTSIGMGQYMAGQQLAMSEELGSVYRAAAELARPHFGASALAVAPESNRQRVAVHWGDQAFHFGWAQLLFGWQIVIHDRQLRFAIGRDLFAIEAKDRERYHRLAREGADLLESRDRCRSSWVEKQGRQRLLVENFRRQAGGAPKRLLL